MDLSEHLLRDGAGSVHREVQHALEGLSRAGAEERGAVFTKPAVVRQMLDWLGYTPERELSRFRLLEPCFGGGDFLLEALERLLASYFTYGGSPRNADGLESCLCGVELHRESYEKVIHRVINRLVELGITRRLAAHLAHTWLIQGDFLLTELDAGFTHVVGNPPYLRPERIPAALLAEYRRRYPTFSHRADLYVPFFERGLRLLEPQGRLAYLCSDRWMKNRYGQALRRFVAEGYRLERYADLKGHQPFQDAVIAYPAITLIARTEQEGGSTEVIGREGRRVRVGAGATPPDGPWLLELGEEFERLREWERRFPPLEQVGCRVGIGVASGADEVFVQPADLGIEEERKLPLLLSSDVRSGKLEWSGRVLVNPWDEEGHLVALERYPRLKAYLEAHRTTLARRYVARQHPEQWFRTIDRVDLALRHTPKLLIPDLAGHPIVVLDEGQYYPHHNLYWVTSTQWPLTALQAVLRSSVASLFVRAYSVEMRGGYHRYQAQTLRRIRLPRWGDLPQGLKRALTNGTEQVRQRAINELYGS
ncbi:Eco57I restriction-modification methylase domain-containing protein [Calidithermus roseus]|uniref:site-specific DNA-methyltransferase (adenine-specific) n=1 Tax=Calidithermus roseus TaxID=1644118 RepID=A0A399EJ62_9DEIN|nr:TaqI-like C-terminal specificity domain-containing protein [Calidithermus roseus]RIH83988.1 Modification methylase PaeR7I [Calidithermus roseus]